MTDNRLGSTRPRTHRRPRRRGVPVPLAVIGLVASLVLLPPSSAFALSGSTFQGADGDLLGTGGTDWQSAPNLAIGYDKPTGQGDDSFGQGTKEDTEVPSVVSGQIPNNKSDLTRLYVSSETISSQSFLYLAWERVQEPNGTTNMDFEFNQSRTLSSNGITPVRTAGDLLVKYDLSQGGTSPSLGIHRWVTTASALADPNVPDTAAGACEAANSFPCWGKVKPLDGTTAEGTVNTGTTSDPVGTGAPRDLTPRTFGEGAINLTTAGVLDPDHCTSFGSAYLKSRSSDTFSSAVKDFLAPIPVDINNCQPATINLKKVDGANQPLAGAVMQLFLDNGDGVLGTGDTQVGSNCTTPANGICTFSGITVSGTYIGHELTAPNGYQKAADQKVDVVISNLAQNITLTFVDTLAPGRINITKADDSGAFISGVTFTLTSGASTVGSCVTGTQGTCSITNVAPGSYTIDESTIPAGYDKDASFPKAVVVPVGSTPETGAVVTVSATNPRLHRVITLVCHEGSNTLDASSVVLGGVPKTSINAVPSALVAKGVTDADLCSLGGAQYGGIAGHDLINGSVTPGS